MSDIDFDKKIREGLNLTYRRLIAKKQKENEPIITSKNGVIQYINPHSIEL